MTTAAEAGKRYTRESLLAFLEGKGDEKWAAGIMRASRPEDIKDAMEYLSYLSDNPRYATLKNIVG